MMSSDELPVLSSDSEPLSAKISSFMSLSIMIACTVRPIVPLDQRTGWKRTLFKLGEWVTRICMDAYQLRAPNKIYLKAAGLA